MIVVLAIVFGAIVMVLLAVEVHRVNRDIRFARALRRIGTAECADSQTIEAVANIIADARAATPARLMQRLLPIVTSSAGTSQQKIWRPWHRVHIPAYVLMKTRTNAQRQRGVITALFDGLTASVQKVMSDRGATGSSCITFDEFWPVIECIEEAAIHTHSDNNDLFASRLATFAMRCNDETIHVQLGWVVNELMERSPQEARLGMRIASALAARSRFARESLHTLITYKRLLHDGHLEGSAATLEAELKRIDAMVVDEDRAAWNSERKKILDQLAQTHIDTITNALSSNETDVLRKVAEATSAIFKGVGPSSGVKGVIALAAMRRILAVLAGKLKAMDSTLAPNVCRVLMQAADDGKVPAFLVIEASESMRDRLAKETAQSMADFLRTNPGALEPGIAVCISEGIEDGLDQPGGDERLKHAVFEPMAPLPEDILIFWHSIASKPLSDPEQERNLKQWMEARLELRRLPFAPSENTSREAAA
jgi:hypothetical protein